MRLIQFIASSMAIYLEYDNVPENLTVTLKSLGENTRLLGDGPGGGTAQRKFANNIEIVQTMLDYLFSMNGIDRVTVDDLLNYGCWCQIKSELSGTRKGLPVDNIDRTCQNYYRCGRCVIMDTFVECNPVAQIYGFYYDPAIKGFQCGIKNNECQMMACECDVHFVNNIVFSLNEYNSYYANSHGWEAGKMCKASLLNKGPADKCCGEYPTRFPFNSEGGVRDCCAGKTFNSINLECCKDSLLAKGACAATTAPTTQKPVCPCMNGGICRDNAGSTICLCPTGYTGNLCEWGPCEPNPCLNGQCDDTSVETGIQGSFICLCDMFWQGQFCDVPDTTPVDPCIGVVGPCPATTTQPRTTETRTTTTIPEPPITDPTTTEPTTKKSTSGTPTETPSTHSSPFGDCALEGHGTPCGSQGDCTIDGDTYNCVCQNGFQGEHCDKTCDLSIEQRIDLAIVIDTSGSQIGNKQQVVQDFVRDLLAEFDTQTVMKVSITAVGDSRTGQVETVFGPVQFATAAQLDDAIQSITWYGETTAVGGGMTAGADTLNTNDNVVDYIMVITDGFDGDLSVLQTVSAAVAADDIIALGVAYDETPGILVSTLTEIANGVNSNVFTAGSNAALQSLETDIFNTLCSSGSRSVSSTWRVRKIINQKIYETASRYKNKFGQIPTWMPNYKQWKKQQIRYFRFKWEI